MIKKILNIFWRDVKYTFNRKEYLAKVTIDPIITENGSWVYRVKELGFFKQSFILTVKEKTYSKGEIITIQR